MKAPAQDSAQTASIFKTRSFQFLVDTVGAENIAIALESSITRVAELLKGERFTPETAFHMETTLGLPHGFFDQLDSVKQDVRFTDKHLGRSAEVIVAVSGGHGCRSIRFVSG